MFFRNKDLERRVADLEANLFKMKMDLDTTEIRLNGLLKAYPHGTTRTGAPRKKPGRKPLVKA
jgi:hypothetical protein